MLIGFFLNALNDPDETVTELAWDTLAAIVKVTHSQLSAIASCQTAISVWLSKSTLPLMCAHLSPATSCAQRQDQKDLPGYISSVHRTTRTLVSQLKGRELHGFSRKVCLQVKLRHTHFSQLFDMPHPLASLGRGEGCLARFP